MMYKPQGLSPDSDFAQLNLNITRCTQGLNLGNRSQHQSVGGERPTYSYEANLSYSYNIREKRGYNKYVFLVRDSMNLTYTHTQGFCILVRC